jgi:hypothetical protein
MTTQAGDHVYRVPRLCHPATTLPAPRDSLRVSNEYRTSIIETTGVAGRPASNDQEPRHVHASSCYPPRMVLLLTLLMALGAPGWTLQEFPRHLPHDPDRPFECSFDRR